MPRPLGPLGAERESAGPDPTLPCPRPPTPAPAPLPPPLPVEYGGRSLLPPEPTWADEASLWQLLVEERHVVLTPGHDCGAAAPGFFRLCYAAVQREALAEAATRLKAHGDALVAARKAEAVVAAAATAAGGSVQPAAASEAAASDCVIS